MTAGRVLLSDNLDLTPDEFARLDAIRAQIRPLVDDRAAIIERHGIDRRFSLPDAGWSDAANDFVNAYQHLAVGDHAVVNRLRLWSQNFTGYQLMTMRRSEGLVSVNPVPDDFDRWHVEQSPRRDKWARLWRQTVVGVPRKYVFAPPARLGELGWNEGGSVSPDCCT